MPVNQLAGSMQASNVPMVQPAAQTGFTLPVPQGLIPHSLAQQSQVTYPAPAQLVPTTQLQTQD